MSEEKCSSLDSSGPKSSAWSNATMQEESIPKRCIKLKLGILSEQQNCDIAGSRGSYKPAIRKIQLKDVVLYFWTLIDTTEKIFQNEFPLSPMLKQECPFSISYKCEHEHMLSTFAVTIVIARYGMYDMHWFHSMKHNGDLFAFHNRTVEYEFGSSVS